MPRSTTSVQSCSLPTLPPLSTYAVSELNGRIGASAKASLIQAITRQIKPHWSAPQGVDADQLVTVLSFRLNEDGSLAGTPRVVSQSGETAANRPQKALHAERAIRAVQLAAPFDLPPEYYNAWKSIDGARFDRNLSR